MAKPNSSLKTIHTNVKGFLAKPDPNLLDLLLKGVVILCRSKTSQEAEAFHACRLLVGAYKAGKEILTSTGPMLMPRMRKPSKP